MSMFDTMTVLADGLSAQRIRLDITASNMANAQTTRTANGGPYKRLDPVFTAQDVDDSPFAVAMGHAMQSVVVSEVVEDPTPGRVIYDPSHPDANSDGYVMMPNIDRLQEMVNMISASKTYESLVNVMHADIDLHRKILSLGGH